MRKALKHIIPLCLLLLIGKNPVFATTLTASHSTTTIVSITPKEKTGKIGLEHLFLEQTNADNPVLEIYKKRELTVDNEEEDSEFLASKKMLEKTNSYVSFFKPQPSNFSSYYTNNSLAISKEIFHLPSYHSLYLIFEVFRI